MKLAQMCTFGSLVLFAGCADSPEQSADSKATPSPVSNVEQQIRTRIEGLHRQQGAQLLASLEVLIKCGALARKPVIDGLSAPDPRVRASLVYVLGFIGGADGHAAVTARLTDADVGVRYEAAAALLQLGDVSGLAVLIELLASPDARVRYKSMEALAGVAGERFGYEFNAPAPSREAAILRIRAWWQERARAARITAGQNP